MGSNKGGSIFKNHDGDHVFLCCVVGIAIVLFVGLVLLSDSNTSSYNSDDGFSGNSYVDYDYNLSEDEFKSQCVDKSYKSLEKSMNYGYGDKIKISGKVFQISEDSTSGRLLMYVNGDYDQSMYVYYDGTTNVYDGDTITVYGYYKGAYTYISQANFKLTVPSMDAKYIV